LAARPDSVSSGSVRELALSPAPQPLLLTVYGVSRPARAYLSLRAFLAVLPMRGGNGIDGNLCSAQRLRNKTAQRAQPCRDCLAHDRVQHQ